MKLFVALCLISVAVAAPAPAPAQQRISYSPNDVQLLKYENDNLGLGDFKFAYELSDGTKQEQQGQLLNEGQENESIVIKGSYSWVGPDGVTYNVNFVADDNGFQPEIEQGPGGGVPPAVVASLLG